MMARNKFAAMLHRNTICWIEIVLIYTFLEWILIGLLFLNAFFCYLISRYVSYFGLKSSCPLCSRLDLIFYHHQSSTANPLVDLVCDKHVSEIAQLRIKAVGRRCLRCVDEGLMDGIGADTGELTSISSIRKVVGGKDSILEGKSARLSSFVERSVVTEDDEEEEDRERRECRGVATADDTGHLYKTGSCKRVHGNNALFKIMNDDNERMRMNVVRSQVGDGKVQMTGDEMFEFFNHVENIKDPGGASVFTVEIADRKLYPPTAKSGRGGGNFVVSSHAPSNSAEDPGNQKIAEEVAVDNPENNMHDEKEWNGCAKTTISRLQEEKAVMQMDASHYRRMMDEQTRYNRKVKQNLLKELDDCHNQIRVLKNKFNCQTE